MDKIDRLGWAEGVSLRSFGASLGVRVNDAGALDALAGVLPAAREAKSPVVERLYSAWIGRPPSRPGLKSWHLLYEDHVRIARTLDLRELRDALASHARLYVAEHAKR